MSRKTAHTPLYVVLRVDVGSRLDDLASASDGPLIQFDRYTITAKEIVTSSEEAQREAARLNNLNREIGCRYFWTQSRFFADGGSFGSELRRR